jgi:cardiolipin synthase A/B
MRYRLHTTSARAWKAMIEAIEKAQKAIYIEMYIFSADTGKRYNFLEKLSEKAQSGVRVVIVVDNYGSRDLKNSINKELLDSGIEFIFFSHWLRHIHRKILIVDETVAFIGGVNIGKKFKHWNDLDLEIEGLAVKSILRSFAYTYSMSGGKDPRIIGYRKRKLSEKMEFWLLEHWPSKSIFLLKNHYIRKINQAKESVQIVTPYFTPPRWLISLLDSAAKRHVKVEIIIPQKSDIGVIDRINYHFIDKLHSLGIKFYLAQKMNHAKIMIIDNKEGLIGSQNIDIVSFSINHEVGIFFKEKEVVAELSQIFQKWKRRSVIFEPKKYRMWPIDYVILALVKIFKPIL